MNVRAERGRKLGLRKAGCELHCDGRDVLCQALGGLRDGASANDRNLLLRAAGTQPRAGEGELLFGPTRHGATLSKANPGVKRRLLPQLFPAPEGVIGRA